MYQLLFVDDEAIIREGVSENVPWESLGYTLAGVCENGREAQAFLRQHPVDVVITDICMPFMDGVELSAHIRQEYPGIKVLILSGYDDFSYARQAIKYGVEEYLLKPLTAHELGELLEKLREKLDKEAFRNQPDRDLARRLEGVRDHILRHVREYDREKLAEDRRLLEQLLGESGMGKQAVLKYLHELKESLDRRMDILGIPTPERELTEELEKSVSIPEAVGVVYDYISCLCEVLERILGNSNASCAYQAYEYIQAHYDDSTLNLREMCSHLGVSTSWFSTLFKQTFHSTFLDVVIGIRMDKAKELLCLTDLKNYEIAEKVGFVDPHYFSIAFKKVTGMSPTEYARERKRNP